MENVEFLKAMRAKMNVKMKINQKMMKANQEKVDTNIKAMQEKADANLKALKT
jgi:hypothetical protein